MGDVAATDETREARIDTVLVGLVRTGETQLYDVLHVDGHREKVVASGLAKQAACELARTEARRRRIGRMFLAGSETASVSECMLIVHSPRNAG